MSSNLQSNSNIKNSNIQTTPSAASVVPLRQLRIWPAIVFVGALWAFTFGIDFAELSMQHRFMYRFAFYGVVLLGFLVWWLAASRARWIDRLLGVGALVCGLLLASALADKESLGKMGAFGILLSSFPFVLTLWTLWLLVSQAWLKNTSVVAQRICLCAAITAPMFFFDLVRWEGLQGNQHADFSWRWTPTSEEKFMAAHSQAKKADLPQNDAQNAAPLIKSIVMQPGDWPEFRGIHRNGQVPGVKLNTDWEHHPPKLLWKQRVGPAWSSVAIVDGKLFTQEQRDKEIEAVVCYDAATGQEIWAHEDSTRFFEPLAGAGPRSTPTFANGKIYTLGGTGKLNCLDATNGKVIWTRDIAVDADAVLPPGSMGMRQWGYSNSPLVVGGNVVAFAGGEHDKGLLAYRADTGGDPVWTFSCGSDGYSSPQLISIDGASELLIHSNTGLFAVDPTKGELLWKQPSDAKMFLPITQPQLVSASRVLTQSPEGVALVEVSHEDEGWKPSQKWDSKALKVSLNDYVVYDGSVYGFDDGVFCCLDLETGKRHWKGGRYGHGQVLLLPDQPLLVVLSESGEAVLIAPNDKKLDELARFAMIDGKTWNHPVIAHGKMFVRNAEEMACYELPQAEKQQAEK